MIFANALRRSPELHDLYANPVDEATKLTITNQLAKKMKASDLAIRTLEVLVKHNRINDIDAINDALKAYVNTALGVAVATVRSAKPLGADEIQELADTLSKKVGKKVELDIKTDPNLLGGFVVQIGSEIWDASVVGKINKFRESLA
jgi:F-type H+-transporting ATPase subunit delta